MGIDGADKKGRQTQELQFPRNRLLVCFAQSIHGLHHPAELLLVRPVTLCPSSSDFPRSLSLSVPLSVSVLLLPPAPLFLPSRFCFPLLLGHFFCPSLVTFSAFLLSAFAWSLFARPSPWAWTWVKCTKITVAFRPYDSHKVDSFAGHHAKWCLDCPTERNHNAVKMEQSNPRVTRIPPSKPSTLKFF